MTTAARTNSEPEPKMVTVRTPEGMLLHFQLASVSERFVAMAIDLTARGLAMLLLFRSRSWTHTEI